MNTSAEEFPVQANVLCFPQLTREKTRLDFFLHTDDTWVLSTQIFPSASASELEL